MPKNYLPTPGSNDRIIRRCAAGNHRTRRIPRRSENATTNAILRNVSRADFVARGGRKHSQSHDRIINKSRDCENPPLCEFARRVAARETIDPGRDWAVHASETVEQKKKKKIRNKWINSFQTTSGGKKKTPFAFRRRGRGVRRHLIYRRIIVVRGWRRFSGRVADSPTYYVRVWLQALFLLSPSPTVSYAYRPTRLFVSFASKNRCPPAHDRAHSQRRQRRGKRPTEKYRSA